VKNSIIILLLTVVLSYLSSKNFLLFHSSIELFSIIIAFNIFIIAFNTFHISEDSYFTFIGIAYGFIGFFDLIHTFAYKGMNIFTNYGANLPTQLWIISRYLESISLLIAFVFLYKKLNKKKVIFIYLIISVILLLSIFYWGIFPNAFVKGLGLTSFKIISEYIISGIIVAAIILLRVNKEEFNSKMYYFLLGSLVMTILAEVAFTFYVSVYGISNVLGHLFKMVSFYLIYKAINEISLQKPYETLFYKLNQEKNKVQKYLNVAEVIFLVIDKDGIVKVINKKGCEILDYDEEEIVGKDWFDNFIKEAEREEIRAIFNKVVNEEIDIVEYFENSIVTKTGEEKTIAWHNALLKDDEGSIKEILSSGMDITQRKAAEKKIKHMSYHDDLTDLYNRKYYEERLRELNVKSKLPLTILIADVNNLKLINDVFGHEIGDNLLKSVANIIKNCTRNEDVAARWGGDEFGIVLPQTSKQIAQKVIERIKKNCQQSNFEPIPPSVSLGSATKVDVDQKIEDIFNKAEDRMYDDKFEYKNDAKNPMLKAIMDKVEETNYGVIKHTSRLVNLAKKLGEKLELSNDQINELIMIVKFHDIGKFIIPNSILHKNTSLSDEEWEQFKRHSEVGYNIAKNFKYLNSIANYILHHHENWDGSGYPQSLSGNSIPLLSRITHVIDVYDAMTNNIYYPITKDIYYKSSLSKDEAIKEIEKKAGEFFDPDIVEVFIEMLS
ncbi:MAG: multi-sensor signal transduction histidine kinase, partial [Candidatus Frackibacter sp. T328-2]